LIACFEVAFIASTFYFCYLVAAKPTRVTRLEGEWDSSNGFLSENAAQSWKAGGLLATAFGGLAVFFGTVTYSLLFWMPADWGGVSKGVWYPLRPTVALLAACLLGITAMRLLLRLAEKRARAQTAQQ